VGTVLTVGSNTYTYAQLPQTNIWVDANTAYSYTGTVSAGTGKQYVLTGTAGLATPIVATGTATPTYKTQYQCTFQQSGLSSDASGTVLTVGSTTYTYSQLPQTSIWVDSGTTFSYTGTVAVSGGTKQYVWTSNTGGLTSPITATGTVTGTYKTQYQVTFVTTGTGTTSPSGTSVWENAGSLSISATAGTNYHFSSWTATTGITITSSTSASTTATIGASGTITANFNPNIAIDAHNGGSATSGSSMTITLTTNNPNDVLYLSIISRTSYVTGVTSTLNSLTWTCREASGSTIALSNARYVSTWYAIQPSSGATTITITFNTATTGASVVVFGISGADTSSPFDGNAAYTTGTGTSATVSKTTTNANDLIIGSLALRSSNPTPTVGSGYTLIQTASQTTNTNEVSAEYKTVSSSGSQSAGYTWSGSDDWAMIIDAINQAS
jgi:hypothetical protein